MAIIVSGLEASNKVAVNYKGQQLNLIKEKQGEIWDKYPVRITDSEWRTLNEKLVLAIMQGKDLTPSLLAGLQPNEIVCETINLIDTLYHDAINNYIDRLGVACDKDRRQIQELMKSHEWTPTKVTVGTGSGSGALGAALGAPFGLPGRMAGGAVGTLMGLLIGYFGSQKLVQQGIEHEGSAHRIKWMQSVDILEEKRIDEIFKFIRNASVPLVEDLIQLEREDQTDKRKVKQLKQLLKVHRVLFTPIPLEVPDPTQTNEKIDVSQYLHSLAQRFLPLQQMDH